MATAKQPKQVTALKHDDAKRPNIPTAELQPVMTPGDQSPIQVAYERRNRDLDPQLVWSGKDHQDGAGLTVQAPPLFIQEKVHPQALIRDLMRASDQRPGGSDQGGVGSDQRPVAGGESDPSQLATDHSPLTTAPSPPATQIGFADLFADFNGLEGDAAAKTEFYQHDANWTNRMILGDSLQVMASLAEKEGLRGKVQCIYIDPPYGIKFNSNFQWSTTSRDVRDGNAAHITREPEQVKAFRDTWRYGIHSYLSYLRDRLEVARDLLADSGSVFVQIGDENVHRVRAVMDEVLGENNFVSVITVQTTTGFQANYLGNMSDFIIWYAKDKNVGKARAPLYRKDFLLGDGNARWLLLDDFSYRGVAAAERSGTVPIPPGARPYNPDNIISQGRAHDRQPLKYRGRTYDAWDRNSHWKASYPVGMERLSKAGRIHQARNSIRYIRFHTDFDAAVHGNMWTDTGSGNFTDDKVYVVQTNTKVIERCILMTTDPGDLVLDPTCGAGTTAYVAEQWGRRWITIDTSRVALALARARIMAARYPYYLLADSPDGRRKEAEISGRWSGASGQGGVATDLRPLTTAPAPSVRQGFVYERVPHITLGAIANNAEIDVIWELYEEQLAPLREELSAASGRSATLEEWEIPRERPEDWPPDTDHRLTEYWELRIERQREIDASIAAKADYEYLYDKPYTDNRKVRVAGPFTVESLSPHRTLGVDENDELIDHLSDATGPYGEPQDFASMILENLKSAGVQQAHVEDRISFTSLTPWPGDLVCADGRYDSEQSSVAGDQSDPSQLATDHSPRTTSRRAAIFIGPEFGTVSRPDLVQAAREAGEAGFDVLIACAFSYEATAAELNKLGRIPVLKARMNADLHMAADLKATGKGNLFVIFGEPDIAVASGRWLVTRDGRMVANHDLVAELSGLASLEQINGLGRGGLAALGAVPGRGTLRHDQPDPAGGGVGAGEHRRGVGTARDEGVPPLPGDRERLAGRDGDLPDAGGTARHGHERAGEPGARSGSGGWADAQRLEAIAALESLREADFPLALTTDHWTQVTVNGVDVFHPNSGEVRSDGPDGIACWFIDTDYNEESFFVRHAYFLGQNDPYKSLKTTLKAEIDAEAWETLHSATSRPFGKPASGRIAVKVINHLGDEVMKVFRVG